MKERPVIMGAESIAAILAGTKTQTRRVLRVPKGYDNWPIVPHDQADGDGFAWLMGSGVRSPLECPYGKPGDRLWVREGWAVVDQSDHELCLRYRADPGDDWWINPGRARREPYADANFRSDWRSPLYMPRWASRLTLAITDVRVERLRDITGDDAVAEGCDAPVDEHFAWQEASGRTMHTSGPRARFAIHWNTLNEKRGYPWQANPWVWVVTFERVKEAS